jgi:hypothetical protein
MKTENIEFKFGNWVVDVDKEVITYSNGVKRKNVIYKESLNEEHGKYKDVFDWPIHILTKIDEKEDIDNFNKAFVFALGYFEIKHLSKNSLKNTFLRQMFEIEAIEDWKTKQTLKAEYQF